MCHGIPRENEILADGDILMALTIEPVINGGGPEVLQLDDGWTVVTRDGSLSAQYEHTVLVVDDGAEILTVPP